MYECLITCQTEKKYIWNWSKILHENINQEHNLLPGCVFQSFTYACCENCMPGFFAFVLNLSNSGNLLFRSMQWKLSVQLRIIITGRRDNSLVHVEMAAVKLHVNARDYTQHSALKPVYGKSQSVIGCKLFSSYRTLLELAQGLRDSKISDLNCSYDMRHLSRKKHWPYVKIVYLYLFMCSVIITNFRKVHTSVLQCWLTKEEQLFREGKALPLLPHPQYICCKYIIENRGGGIHSFIAFYKLFLNYIKVKILMNSWHFLMIFWIYRPFDWHLQFSVNKRC